MKKYSKRHWLNKKGSPSTGSLVAYYGPNLYDGKLSVFLEVSDCGVKCRLHLSRKEKMSSFLYKLKKMKTAIEEFELWIEQNHKQ